MKLMIRRFLRQKFGNVGILLILITISLLTVFSLAAGRAAGPATLAVLLLAPGAVSRDISSGTVQVILARPIRRSEYLLGRYFGILAAYGAVLAFSVLLSLMLRPAFSGVFGSPALAAPSELLRTAGGAWLDGALLAATLLFFSTFLPGIGDLLAYFLLQIGLGVAGSLGQHFPNLAQVARVARENLFPEVSWSEVFRGEGLLGAGTGRYVLTLTTILIGGLFIFSRREFSYGHD